MDREAFRNAIASLQERKVFRAAAAYVVVAWLLIEVCSVVLPALNVPPWGMTLIVILVFTGFPIALILSWAFDITSQGIVSGSAGADPDQRQRADSPNEIRVESSKEKSKADSGISRGPERRKILLLACIVDVRNSGQSLDSDEDVSELQYSFHRSCKEIVERFDGVVIGPMNERLLAGFVTSEGAPTRAIRAALHLCETSSPDVQQPTVSVGLHVGSVIVDDSSDVDTMTITPQDDATRVAFEVAEAADSNTAFLSADAYKMANSCANFEQVDSLEAASTVYRLVGEKFADTRFERAEQSLTPFVGRDEEFRCLSNLWQRSRLEGQVAMISGEPGIGKSRLVHELRKKVSQSGGVRLTCQCWSHFQNTAFYPIVNLLLRSTGIDRSDPPEMQHRKLVRALLSLDLSLDDNLPYFAQLLSIPLLDQHAMPQLSAEEFRSRSIDALVAMLMAMSSIHSVLLIVEDLHWVDKSTEELFDRMIGGIQRSQILVVLTYRPEYHAEFPAPAGSAHVFKLARLDVDDAARMVVDAAGQALPDSIVERLTSHSDGVPLFIEELSRMISEQVAESGVGVNIDEIDIPTTLQEVLSARLDKLDGLAHLTVREAAVIGRTFSYQLLSDITNLSQRDLDEALGRLVEERILDAQSMGDGTKYMFSHALMQQTAYDLLLRRDRHQYHLRVAQYLAKTAIVDLNPELLAHHCFASGNYEQAIDHWVSAGARSMQQSASHEAIGHFKHAIVAVQKQPVSDERNERELGILIKMGSPLMAVVGYSSPQVRHLYSRAEELCRLTGDTELFSVLHGRWEFALTSGQLSEALLLAEQLHSVSDNADITVQKLLALRTMATTLLLLGRLEAARDYAERGIAVYDVDEHGALAQKFGLDPGVAHYIYAGWIYWLLGEPGKAQDRVRRGLEIALQIDDAHSIALAYGWYGLVFGNCGDYEAAADAAAKAIPLCETHHFEMWMSIALFNKGRGLWASGDWDAGIQLMEEGTERWLACGARVGSIFPLIMANACLSEGLIDEAREKYDSALAMTQDSEEKFCDPEIVRLGGELLRQQGAGNDDEIEEIFRNGLAQARSQGARSWEQRIATSYGQLLIEQNRHADARAIMASVDEWFGQQPETEDRRVFLRVWEQLLSR